VSIADGTDIKIILISDGLPNVPDDAMRVAKTFKNRIDCIYIGPKGDMGEDFMFRLANLHGGKQVTIQDAQQIAATTERLLLNGGA
jgi:hypothetical protein